MVPRNSNECRQSYGGTVRVESFRLILPESALLTRSRDTLRLVLEAWRSVSMSCGRLVRGIQDQIKGRTESILRYATSLVHEGSSSSSL